MAVQTLADIQALESVPLARRELPASTYEALRRCAVQHGQATALSFFLEASNFRREDELLHQFREKIKLRPELKVLAPGTLPPQIRPIEDKRVWD